MRHAIVVQMNQRLPGLPSRKRIDRAAGSSAAKWAIPGIYSCSAAIGTLRRSGNTGCCLIPRQMTHYNCGASHNSGRSAARSRPAVGSLPKKMQCRDGEVPAAREPFRRANKKSPAPPPGLNRWIAV
jgi:hypothetical protein